MKRRFLYTLSILCLAGCNLNEYCDEDQYQLDGKCYRCRVGEHLNADKTGCETNTDTDCGVSHQDCTSVRNAKSASCNVDNGACKVICNDGFSEIGGRCVDSQFQSCVSDRDCSILHASSAKCQDSVCIFTCNDGYHLATASSCVENVFTSCDSDDACKALEGVENAKCGATRCEVSKCIAGYHLNDEKTACDKDTATMCGAEKMNCNSLEGVSKSECVDGQCRVISCKLGSHLSKEGESCEQDTKAKCGEKQLDCTGIKHVIEPKCDEGSCMFRCEDGYNPDYENRKCIFSGSCPILGTDYIEEIDACLQCINITFKEEEGGEVYETETLRLSNSEVYDDISVTCLLNDLRIVSWCGINNEASKPKVAFNQLRYIRNDLSVSPYSSKYIPKELSFKNLEYVNKINITANYDPLHLESVLMMFNSLQRTKNDINFENIDIKENTTFPELVEVGGALSMENVNLNDVVFPSLSVVKGDLRLSAVKNSVLAIFPELKEVNGNLIFDLSGNPIDFPKLNRINGQLSINYEAPYTFPELQSVGSLAIDMRNSDKTNKIIEFPKLDTVSKDLSINGYYTSSDRIVTQISFPLLTKAESITIQKFNKLESINMPKLKKLGDGKIKIAGCPKLTQENCNLGENECVIAN